MNLFPRTTGIDFLKHRNRLFVLSGLVILVGLVAVAGRGSGILSLDFTGGHLIHLDFPQPPDTAALRETLIAGGYPDISIQRTGEDGDQVILRTRVSGEELLPLIRASFPGQEPEVLGEEQISPIMGQTIRRQTIIGFFAALGAILVYISVRFELRFAVTAIIALVHDLLIALTFLALTGRRLDSIVIAAFLTIAGYSVNDTVVIFDRIRENLRGMRKLEGGLEPLFNRSVNENISRTVITSFSTLLAAGCLYFLGGPVLNDFAFLLLVGVVSGTYSSIFIATSLIAAWEKKSPHRFKT